MKLTKFLRTVTEILAFLLFLFLFFNGKLQSWILIFGGLAILSLFFGRFYCGWICPIQTVFRPVGWIYKKLRIKRFSTPKFMKHPVVRYIILLFFIGLLIAIRVLKIKIPLLLFILIGAFIITLFFKEEFWHKVLCPYGAILSIVSQPAMFGLEIEESECIGCGLCQKVCNANAIKSLNNKKRRIINNECLLCFECKNVCPVKVISYKH
ncbi:4Fe-4S binding protein [Thermosipho ferrireducens]|uniref:4Fe-4S binding protein n=1 Tax=Thermosipho ferrireducens TaxID=2571116 RepID=A0ABX7SA85_9BACT|nr:4Fe-4S binding protein [Thermosipho ferrireducens]QTA38175.1 4Fe-4S binding protein [Thermosipho ferrireducens]